MNPLYLIIHSATGYFKEENDEKNGENDEKNGNKYLVLDLIEKYEEVFSGIISEIKTIKGGKKMFYEKNYAKLLVNTDHDVPLNKQIKFPTLAIIITCVFQEGEKLYPQVYLDEYLYES